MRLLLVLAAGLLMSLVAGVAMARFTINGTVVSSNDGLIMPRAAATVRYAELCGSCSGPDGADAVSASAVSGDSR